MSGKHHPLPKLISIIQFHSFAIYDASQGLSPCAQFIGSVSALCSLLTGKENSFQGKNFILTSPFLQSRLICSISGRALDENNQPMMLPNGKPIAFNCWSLYLKQVLIYIEITRLCLWRASTDEPSGPKRRQSYLSEVEASRFNSRI